MPRPRPASVRGRPPAPDGTVRRVFAPLAALLLWGGGCEWTTDVVAAPTAVLAPGSFRMGSPPDEPGRGEDETPHDVALTRRLAVLSTEVSQADFEARMGYDPSWFVECGADCPVENLNWHEAAAYCNARSASEDLPACYTCTGAGRAVRCEPDRSYAAPQDCPGYRLPTEAEWEYAARAGTTTATYNGTVDARRLWCEQPNEVMDPIAWFCGNAGGTTHPTALKSPNAWRLYDTLGNVLEWCHDWYGPYPGDGGVDPRGPDSGGQRVMRGGAHHNDARGARAANRASYDPLLGSGNLGFRPVRSLPP